MKKERNYDLAMQFCVLFKNDKKFCLQIEEMRRGGLVGADRAGTW
jgi:hypothetical protein